MKKLIEAVAGKSNPDYESTSGEIIKQFCLAAIFFYLSYRSAVTIFVIVKLRY